MLASSAKLAVCRQSARITTIPALLVSDNRRRSIEEHQVRKRSQTFECQVIIELAEQAILGESNNGGLQDEREKIGARERWMVTNVNDEKARTLKLLHLLLSMLGTRACRISSIVGSTTLRRAIRLGRGAYWDGRGARSLPIGSFCCSRHNHLSCPGWCWLSFDASSDPFRYYCKQ